MARFVAHVELAFECESQAAVGVELRRLQQTLRDARFELRSARAEPAPPEDDDGPTFYVPLLEPEN